MARPKNEAAIVDREGKSDIWKLFGAVEREQKVISNLVACKASVLLQIPQVSI